MRDRDVRGAVRQYLAAQHLGDSDTRIVEEMPVWSGTVRIDIAVINGEMTGFELKSDRDTLQRLPQQARVYSKVFDRVVLVVGQRHAAKAGAAVPSWWGVMSAALSDGTLILKAEREPGLNPEPDPLIIADLLTKDELICVLESLGIARGMRSKGIRIVREAVLANLSLGDLRSHVRGALKIRKNWLGQNPASQLNMPVNADINPML